MGVTAEVIATHNSETDCWCILGDDVYDVTNFMSEHPGGKKAIMLFAGKDATEEFDMLHDRKVIRSMASTRGPSRARASSPSEGPRGGLKGAVRAPGATPGQLWPVKHGP